MIFARRELQRAICRVAAFADPLSIQRVVDILNRRDRTSLHAEWELMVIDALGTALSIDFEPLTPGGSRPDIVIVEDRRPVIVADVGCVSDQAADRANPIEAFDRQFRTVAKNFGLDPSRLSLDIRGKLDGVYGNQQVNLGLPQTHNAKRFIIDNFGTWFGQLRSGDPKAPTYLRHRRMIAIDERGSDESGYTTWVSHTAVYSRHANPIWTQLKKKSRQLRKSGLDAARGVILCDCGCSVIKGKQSTGSGMSYKSIVREFLSNVHSLDFVIRVWIESDLQSRPNKPKVHIETIHRSSLEGEQLSLLQKVIVALQQLPRPDFNSETAAYVASLKRNEGLDSRFNGAIMEGHKVKFSMKQLCLLLAGEQTIDELHDHYGGRERSLLKEAFESNIRSGRLIRKIRLIPSPETDDDWIEIEFGFSDAAVSDFQVPPLKRE